MGRRARRRDRLARFTEAVDFTFDEIQSAVADAIEDSLGEDTADGEAIEVWIQDIGADWVVYSVDGVDEKLEDGLNRVGYTMADDGTVTLEGSPEKVKVEYAAVTESRDHFAGRVIEARGDDKSGGRVYGVQIIEHGTSKNNRRYPSAVLAEAASLYDGAKAFDHHRTDLELHTSTVVGLVGHYESVRPNMTGLEGELHVLRSRSDIAEAFDASLIAQEKGLPPTLGISHDVQATYREAREGSRRLQEATKIVRVLSADVVADPAAGGRAIRMVAGGDPQPSKEDDMNIKQLLALLRDADPAKRAELLKEYATVLDEAGLSETDIERILIVDEPDKKTPPAPVEAETDGTEPEYKKDSISGRQLVKAAVADKLGDVDAEKATESIMSRLGERFTETQLVDLVEMRADALRFIEADGLAPRVPDASVTKDDFDKKIEKLDRFFDSDRTEEGERYHSFKAAFVDISGVNPYRHDMLTADFNRVMLRESIGGALYDSGERMTESADTTSWNLALGDSITRRLVAEYARVGLDDWKQLVSSSPPINDFRTQRIDRIGGYGTLPIVNQGAPYQPLTTPTNEEITYSINKRGGTEDLTLEVIANDDVRWISRIPLRLGRAAATSLWAFAWNFIFANPNCTYDSTALFAAGHNNATTVALTQANLSAARAKMRKQAVYGSSALDILHFTPATLVVPTSLEEMGWSLVTSTVGIPVTTPGATNVPNIHHGMNLIVNDLLEAGDTAVDGGGRTAFTGSSTAWFIVADTGQIPSLEIGYYQGQETPQLFAQTDPTVGAVFNADKITYKIRHIYGGALIDHRAFVRGNV